MFDGELVAFGDDGRLDFDLVCRQLLHGDERIPLAYLIFDALALRGRKNPGWARYARERESARARSNRRCIGGGSSSNPRRSFTATDDDSGAASASRLPVDARSRRVVQSERRRSRDAQPPDRP